MSVLLLLPELSGSCLTSLYFCLDQFQDNFFRLVFKISPVSCLTFKTFLLLVDFKNSIRVQYLISFFEHEYHIFPGQCI